MPTGIGLKKLFCASPGVNAFGTKISGAVLNTFMRMVSNAKQFSGSISFHLVGIDAARGKLRNG